MGEKLSDLPVVPVVQRVSDCDKAIGHMSQQRFDILGVFIDHGTGSLRISQRHTGHVTPRPCGEGCGDIAVGIVRQLIDQRRGDHMRHVGDKRRRTIMRAVVDDDAPVGAPLGDHARYHKETPVIGRFVHGDCPQGMVEQAWIRSLEAGTLGSSHRMGAHIAVPQTRGDDLLPHQGFYTADIGQGGRRAVDNRGKPGEHLWHGFQRIAQYDEIGACTGMPGEFLERGHAYDAVPSGLFIRVRAVVPRNHPIPVGRQMACQGATDQAQSDNADRHTRLVCHRIRLPSSFCRIRRIGRGVRRACDALRMAAREPPPGIITHHSNSLAASTLLSHASGMAWGSKHTPPCGNIHSLTGGFGRSLRG